LPSNSQPAGRKKEPNHEELETARLVHVIGDDDAQLRTEAEPLLDGFDRAFNLDAIRGTQVANRSDASAVLVAQRQVEPEILDAQDAQPRQRRFQGRADSGQAGDGCQAWIG